jgi:hypothetical protein
MPCSRQSAGTATPASACLRTVKIWPSLNQGFFMQNFLNVFGRKFYF